MDFIYPDLDLSIAEKKIICLVSFPDSNSF